jgi:hypothetical protein
MIMNANESNSEQVSQQPARSFIERAGLPPLSFVPGPAFQETFRLNEREIIGADQPAVDALTAEFTELSSHASDCEKGAGKRIVRAAQDSYLASSSRENFDRFRQLAIITPGEMEDAIRLVRRTVTDCKQRFSKQKVAPLLARILDRAAVALDEYADKLDRHERDACLEAGLAYAESRPSQATKLRAQRFRERAQQLRTDAFVGEIHLQNELREIFQF